MSIRSLQAFLALFCLVSFLFAGFGLATEASKGRQQNPHRTVDKLPRERNEPISIRGVKVNGNKIRRNKKFVANDDWLRGLTIEIKNKSDKVVLFASIQLQFPNPLGSEGRIAVHQISYGNPELFTRPPTMKEGLQGIGPDETAELKLMSDEFEGIRILLAGNGHSLSPEKLNLRIGKVIFDDDTMWKYGSVFRREASSSYGWTETEEPVAARNGWLRSKTPVKMGLLRSHHSSLWPEAALPQILYPDALHPQSCRKFTTVILDCGIPGWACRYEKDVLREESGCYYLASASFLCTTASRANCNWNYHDSQVVNQCSGCNEGSGGGGGGGGGEEGGCWSDWDCGAGEQCCTGACQEYSNFGCLQP